MQNGEQQRPLGSDARKQLARMIKDFGIDGALVISRTAGDGSVPPWESDSLPDLPPGSMAYPPCRCPRHREEGAVAEELSL
ncbi:hypothetical protein [Streptomyces sp. NPDC054863]